MGSASGRDDGLSAVERERLAALRSAGSLADLERVTGAASAHDAYFKAKREWRDLRARELAASDAGGGLPGACVVVDGHEFHVHGVTHADTSEERAYLREHVAQFVEDGAFVYCEQGIRSMYFDDIRAVCGMDDYTWAMRRCEELGLDSHAGDLVAESFDGLVENVDALSARFRDVAFSLIDAGQELYGEGFTTALGDVASSFFTSHADAATGDDFEAFRLTRAAARDPDELAALQRYYETRFLPQPLEREWLRRHDRELELVTHARNERMADYAVYHNETAEEVHLVVGAAHQPGVRYYLERHRDGDRSADGVKLYG